MIHVFTSQRGVHDGVPEDRPGPGDVRGELLQHQEQEGLRAVPGRGRPGPQHLRAERQVGPSPFTTDTANVLL